MLIGIDIIDIERVRKAVCRTPRFLSRIFTGAELDYCLRKKNPYPALAARFAAKEAVRKLHKSLARCRWQDIEVCMEAGGRPVLCLHGQAAAAKRSEKLAHPDISLSHSVEQAVAAAVTVRLQAMGD